MSLSALRLTRVTLTRNTSCLFTPLRRSFMRPTAIRQVDIVQEMYLRELKIFKPTPIKPSDSEGHVQKFAMPATPTSPEEANIQNELKAYEDQAVEVEGQSNAADGSNVEHDWFVEEEEDDDGAHGH